MRGSRFLFLLTLAFLAFNAAAQDPDYFADFDGAGIPNAAVNDPATYKPENAAIVWALRDFPANGTQALTMAASGCGSSGNTPLPGVDGWSDGIIQIDFGWLDDDSWGVMFRHDSDTEGYFLFVGFTETLELALFDLGQIGYRNATCLGDMGLEEGPEPGRTIIPGTALANTLHGFDPGDQTGGTSYTVRVRAEGSSIRCWYGVTDDFPDNPLTDPDPADVNAYFEVEDSAWDSGRVGIWHESNDNGLVDNIRVYGASALAVSPKEKAATTWAVLKAETAR